MVQYVRPTIEVRVTNRGDTSLIIQRMILLWFIDIDCYILQMTFQ